MIDKAPAASNRSKCSSSTTDRPTAPPRSSGNARLSPRDASPAGTPGKQGLGTAHHGTPAGAEQGFDSHLRDGLRLFRTTPTTWWLYSGAAEGNDVVVGSRYAGGVNVVNWPMSRLLMSYFSSDVRTHRHKRLPLRDATAGFVQVTRVGAEYRPSTPSWMKGYGFQIER